MFYCDDGDDAPPELRRWRPKDHLTPEPPRGWLIATTFAGPHHPLDIAAWLYILASAQIGSKEHGTRCHAIARGDCGTRVLLVAPAIENTVTEAALTVHYAITGCSCGGADCLEPDLQEAAARVIARRKWNALPAAERIDMMLDRDEDADVALSFAGLDEVVAQGHPDVMFEVAYAW